MKSLRKIGIVVLVAVLMIGLALPAAAKGGWKGGQKPDFRPGIEKGKGPADGTGSGETVAPAKPQGGVDDAAAGEKGRDKGKDKERLGQALSEARKLAREGKVEEALALLDSLAEAGKDAKVLKVMAEVLAEKGNKKAAIQSLEEALELDSEDGSLYEQLRTLFKAAGDNGIKVYVKGKKPAFDVLPEIVRGRTMVPFRALAEALGGKVAWDPETSTITIFRGRTVLRLTLGSTEAEVDGVRVTLDAPPSVINGRTMVPLRFIGEALNATVEYDPETGMIVIKDAAPTPPPADDAAAPTDGTTAPADGTTPPADGTAAPADSTTAPADSTTAPTDSTTAPAPTESTNTDSTGTTTESTTGQTADNTSGN